MNKKEASEIRKNSAEFSHGKRGVVRKSSDGKFLVKERKKESFSPGTIRNEFEYNLKLNKIGIGPKIFYYDEDADFLIREFIEGKTIFEHLTSAKQRMDSDEYRAEILRIILTIFEQCRKMDLAGINKFEMTNPYKDLIIDKKGSPIIIDFERCRHSEKPKNVTQFCQFLLKGKMRSELGSTKIILDENIIISLAEEYKREQSENNFEKIKKEIEKKLIS